jgi:hypothetical protein
MIEITRDNYEAYAIDYIEGNLAMDIHIKFEVFLSNNHDIAIELEGLPDFIDDQANHLDPKDLLKLKKGALLSADINAENCDFYFAAYHEGDLNAKENDSVREFIKANPTKEADFNQMRVLNIPADKSIHYPSKNELKKAIILPLWIRFARVAAVFLVLLSVAIAYFNKQSKTQVYVEREKVEQQRPSKQSEEEQLKLEGIEQELQVAEVNEQERSSKHSEEEEKVYKQSGIELSPLKDEKERENELVNVSESVKTDQISATIDNETLAFEEPKTLAIPEESTEPQQLATSSSPDDVQSSKPNTIIKFKRPSFRKTDSEEELAAVSEEETLVRIANPLKNKNKRSFSLGPLSIKRN